MLNKAQVIGYLGDDPDIRHTPNGHAVANLSVATTEKWTDKNSGQKQEKTEWHRITLWRRLAEVAEQYLTKGSLVYIEGKIQTRKWQDKDGNDRYTTEIIGDRMQMLGGKGKGSKPAKKDTPPPPEDDFDDDIPF